MPDHRPIYIAGAPVATKDAVTVLNRDSGDFLAHVSRADAALVERAIASAASSAPALRALPTYKRRQALEHIVRRLTERTDEFARTLALEAGKPIKDARGEVARAIDTFRLAAELTGAGFASRGEFMPLDLSPRSERVEGITRRVPVGACSFITPFNFPINLVAHKVAPAIAVGCPFVLKPAPRTPIVALKLAELLAETELPPESWSVLLCSDDDAAKLVEDERINLLSFTGSQAVGWKLKARAGRKRVTLELGGNAAVIVDEDADVERAAERIAFGAFAYAGQSCISVQRILAHESVYDALSRALVDRARELLPGPLLDESTRIGPLIDEDSAKRVELWINEAVLAGGKLLTGGRRDRAFLEPTLVANAPRDAKLACQEAFGPVATLAKFDTFDDALAAANDSPFGLQTGLFTPRLDHAMKAWKSLEVGAVVLNDVPTFRVDAMPYGGVKESGFGREGVRWAMQEMTEERLMVVGG